MNLRNSLESGYYQFKKNNFFSDYKIILNTFLLAITYRFKDSGLESVMAQAV